MSPAKEREEREERILVFAPRGRDAEVMCSVLTGDGFVCDTTTSFESLVEHIEAGAGAAILAEEALTGVDLARLRAWLDGQPSWSDFPFVVLLGKVNGLAPDLARARIGELGNVILLERPLNAQTLRSAVASALRARRRQY